MNPVSRRTFLGSIPGAVLIATVQPSPGDAIPNRPKVPGMLNLRARRRTREAGPSDQVLQWPVARTAIIICDMWDTHTCGMSAQRVGSDGASDESGGQRRPESRRDDYSCAQRHDEILRRHSVAGADAQRTHGGVAISHPHALRSCPARRSAISLSMTPPADAMTPS